MVWVEKTFQNGDETNIVPLLQEVFGSEFQFDLNYWKWLYSTEKNGLGSIIRLAYDEDKLVGHYAIILTEMVIDGHSVIGAQSVDTAVSSTHRRQKIFYNLCHSTLKEAETQGVPIVYGFTRTSGPAWKGFMEHLG